MTNTKQSGTDVPALIKQASVYGRDYTNLRHALIAHIGAGPLPVKQATIAKESDVAAPEVSRVLKAFNALPAKGKVAKAIIALDVAAIAANMGNPTSPVILAAAALGANLARKDNNKKSDSHKGGAKKLPAADSGTVRVAEVDETGKATGKSADVEVFSALFDWLVAVPEEYPARLAIVQGTLANADSYLAMKAAEVDAAA